MRGAAGPLCRVSPLFRRLITRAKRKALSVARRRLGRNIFAAADPTLTVSTSLCAVARNAQKLDRITASLAKILTGSGSPECLIDLVKLRQDSGDDRRSNFPSKFSNRQFKERR